MCHVTCGFFHKCPRAGPKPTTHHFLPANFPSYWKANIDIRFGRVSATKNSSQFKKRISYRAINNSFFSRYIYFFLFLWLSLGGTFTVTSRSKGNHNRWERFSITRKILWGGFNHTIILHHTSRYNDNNCSLLEPWRTYIELWRWTRWHQVGQCINFTIFQQCWTF